MGSGSLTHNLREIGRTDPDNNRYALEFTAWVREHLKNKDIEALRDYRRQAPHALRAHPTEEHFLPLLVALGASDAVDTVEVIEGGMTVDLVASCSPVQGAGGRGARNRCSPPVGAP